jgi:hypothetical protein
MNQLEIRSSRTNRAEIFTRGVSLQDHSSLNFSAQKTHSKWEIISEGGGVLLSNGIRLQVTPNPVVQEINPLVSFASGGRLLTIRGMYF